MIVVYNSIFTKINCISNLTPTSDVLFRRQMSLLQNGLFTQFYDDFLITEEVPEQISDIWIVLFSIFVFSNCIYWWIHCFFVLCISYKLEPAFRDRIGLRFHLLGKTQAWLYCNMVGLQASNDIWLSLICDAISHWCLTRYNNIFSLHPFTLFTGVVFQFYNYFLIYLLAF